MRHNVACIQITSTDEVQHNLNTVRARMEQAAGAGAELLVLPEMFALMGMGANEKLVLREPLGQGQLQDFLAETARQLGVWIVGGTIPIAISGEEGHARAACLVYNAEGERVARYDKVHLFDATLSGKKETYQESKTMQAGDQVVVVPTPFGRLGLAVCYDIRFPEMFRLMHAEGVEVIALPTAFTYTTGCAHWEVLVRARAIENMAYVVAACQTGVHPNGRRTYGHSMIINPWGHILASLGEEEGIITAEIDLTYLHALRSEFPALGHRKF